MTVNVDLFKLGLKDGKIVSIGGLKEKLDELLELSEKVEWLYPSGDYTIFEGQGIRMYVKENKIYKVAFYNEEGESMQNGKRVL